MKKLFVVIVTDVEGMQYPIVYYIKAADYFAAAAKVREIGAEDNGISIEELDELYDFDIREFQEDEVIEA